MVVDNRAVPSKGGPGKPRFPAGANRSTRRLATIGYDPIGELVKQYRRLEQECIYLRKLRDGVVVELHATTGKPRAFRYEALIGMETMLQNTADKLLRYGYGRVPEVSVVESKVMQPLVVNLSREGETYVVNGDAEQPMYDDAREEALEADDIVDPLMLEAPPVKGIDPKSIVFNKDDDKLPWDD
jgi:hypothetical protein